MLLLQAPSSFYSCNSSSHFSYTNHTSFSDSLISTSGTLSSSQWDQQSMAREDLTLGEGSGQSSCGQCRLLAVGKCGLLTYSLSLLSFWMLSMVKQEAKEAPTLGLTLGPVDGKHNLRTGYYLQEKKNTNMKSIANSIPRFSSIIKLPGNKPVFSYPGYSVVLKGKKVEILHLQLQNTLFHSMVVPCPH